MAHVDVHSDMELESPILVEGMPGVGLVGKIAADHLVKTLDMEYYASIHCDGLPRLAIYDEGDRAVRPPVRIYADESRDLLVLQSDIPISPQGAPEFSSCLAGWCAQEDVLPLCLSGLPEEKDGVPTMYGIGTGTGPEFLDEHGIETPTENGMISGPTGALLAEIGEQEHDGIGLVVQANNQFPDPEAARVLLVDAIEPITGIEVSTDLLVEQAEEIADAREKLAKQMQQADEESSQAQPLGMYQ
jgi:uncharacterized protein